MTTTYAYLPTTVTIRWNKRIIKFRLYDLLVDGNDIPVSLEGLILRAVNLAEEEVGLARDQRLINYTVALRYTC